MDKLEYIRDVRLSNGESSTKSNRPQRRTLDRNISPIGLLDSVRDSALGGSRSRNDAHSSSSADSSSNDVATCDADYAGAASKAACKLREILSVLDKGESLDRAVLKRTLTHTADLLSMLADKPSEAVPSDSEIQQLVSDEEVRAWLTTTFSREDSQYEKSRVTLRHSFKAVAGTIIIGQYMGKFRESAHLLSYPAGVLEFFNEHLDHWNCNIFSLESLTDQPLRYIGYDLFRKHRLMQEYKISTSTLDSFFVKVEEGYKCHGNLYHNSTHAADVMQTVHRLMEAAKLENWMSPLEVLALLFAAAVHDLEHTGTTNAFHVLSKSDLAFCYNDRSVLENYHLYRAFSILKEDENNILRHLNQDQFRQFRTLVIEMVLATDMSTHFDQLKTMKRIMSSTDLTEELGQPDRSRILSLLLHMSDISHPGKEWALHQEWSGRLTEEFFRQGDREVELGMPCSPMCDRNTTAVPESQIGFIEVIVGPCFDVCGDMLEMIVGRVRAKREEPVEEEEPEDLESSSLRMWVSHLTENKTKWKERCRPKDVGHKNGITLRQNSAETVTINIKETSDTSQMANRNNMLDSKCNGDVHHRTHGSSKSSPLKKNPG